MHCSSQIDVDADMQVKVVNSLIHTAAALLSV
jgi:hypothetical protein